MYSHSQAECEFIPEFFPTATIIQAPSSGMSTDTGACSGAILQEVSNYYKYLKKKNIFQSVRVFEQSLETYWLIQRTVQIRLYLFSSFQLIQLHEKKLKTFFFLCSIVSNCYSCHWNILQLQVEEFIELFCIPANTLCSTTNISVYGQYILLQTVAKEGYRSVQNLAALAGDKAG